MNKENITAIQDVEEEKASIVEENICTPPETTPTQINQEATPVSSQKIEVSVETADVTEGKIAEPKKPFPWKNVLLFPFKLCEWIIVWLSIAVWRITKYSSIIVWWITKYTFFVTWWLVKFAVFLIVFCWGIFVGFFEVLNVGDTPPENPLSSRQPGETYGEYRQRRREEYARAKKKLTGARKGSFRLAGKIWRSLWGISEEEEEE